jgi:hypothetical protein
LEAPSPPGNEGVRLMIEQMVALQQDLRYEVQAIGTRVSQMSAMLGEHAARLNE